ncbi:hypothetical protein GYMLUDRAFT_147472, partial [Collybiopsis luxurians FD-317 M1]
RRPSTYINLEKLYSQHRNVDQGAKAPLPPFENFAHVVLQVNTNDRQRTLHEDYRHYYSPEGFVYPDDRHIVASPQKSTILQFMNQDFGMENCTLEVSIPPQNASWDAGVEIDSRSVLEIWMLDNSEEL